MVWDSRYSIPSLLCCLPIFSYSIMKQKTNRSQTYSYEARYYLQAASFNFCRQEIVKSKNFLCRVISRETERRPSIVHLLSTQCHSIYSPLFFPPVFVIKRIQSNCYQGFSLQSTHLDAVHSISLELWTKEKRTEPIPPYRLHECPFMCTIFWL